MTCIELFSAQYIHACVVEDIRLREEVIGYLHMFRIGRNGGHFRSVVCVDIGAWSSNTKGVASAVDGRYLNRLLIHLIEASIRLPFNECVDVCVTSYNRSLLSRPLVSFAILP